MCFILKSLYFLTYARNKNSKQSISNPLTAHAHSISGTIFECALNKPSLLSVGIGVATKQLNT